MSALALPRLYPILDVDAVAARHLTPADVLDVWLDAGVTFWQLRAKSLASGAMVALLDQLLERSRRAHAICIVNDRADVACICGADGVHVGQTDLSPAAVRRLVGPSAIVGRSTHDERQAAAACAEPISYLAIGPVFATGTKANPDPAVGLDGVSLAARRAAAAGVPLVAIGGITLERAPEVIAAGADAVAAIADVMGGAPGRRARALLDAVSRVEPRSR